MQGRSFGQAHIHDVALHGAAAVDLDDFVVMTGFSIFKVSIASSPLLHKYFIGHLHTDGDTGIADVHNDS